MPVLRYAEDEEFFAVSADALAEHRDSTLRLGGPDGEVIVAAAGQGERLSLGFLGARRYAERAAHAPRGHDQRGPRLPRLG